MTPDDIPVYRHDHQKRLRGNFVKLVDYIDVKGEETILHYLIQEEVIDEDEKETILSKDTPRNATRRLLGYLYTKDYKSFGVFLDALSYTDNDYIVEHLLQYDTSTCPEDGGEIEREIDQEKRIEMLQDMVWKQTAMLQDIQGKLDLLLSAQANNRHPGGSSDTVCSLDVSTRDMDLKRHLQDYVDTQISQKLRGQNSETFDSPDEGYYQIREVKKTRNQKEHIEETTAEGSQKPQIDPQVTFISTKLAKYIIQYISVGSDIEQPQDEYMETMRRVVSELLELYEDKFKLILNKLLMNEMDGLETVWKIADHMLGDLDEKMNWGRVVVLYTFVGWIGKYFLYSRQQFSMDRFLDTLGEYLAFYINSKLGKWIQDNGGWDAFLAQYQQPKTRVQVVKESALNTIRHLYSYF